MKYFKHTYILLILMHLVVGCKSTKFVPKDQYLLKENQIEVSGPGVTKEEMSSIIRQKPNTEILQIKLNLWIYNRVDSTKVAEKRAKENIKIREINSKRIEKQSRKNKKRIAKARENGDSLYTQKIIPLKDTLEPSLFLREWLKYKIGESPIIFDSLLFNKSIDQIGIYLKKKGYYYSESDGIVEYKRNKKAIATYSVITGERYIIDSFYVESTNELVRLRYNEYLKKTNNSLIGEPFDVNLLHEYSNTIAKMLRDEGLYDFSPTLINYVIDTNKTNFKTTVGIVFKERMVNFRSDVNNDSLVPKPYQTIYVKDLYFHIIDTNNFKGNYNDALKARGISKIGLYLPTLDTLYYNEIKYRNSNEIDTGRAAYFLYNGELFLTPDVLEVQSLLGKGHVLTEVNLEKTLARLQQLGLFQTIKTEIIEVPGTNEVNLHYYLIPSKNESFSFPSRLTTSNGYLGFSAGLNYTNKNLFRGAQKLTFGVNGGFQSQPAIFEDDVDPIDLKAVTNKFYQFEISPSVKLELPGLFLIKGSKLNKARLAKTIVSGAYSYQNREVFSKEIIQLNYLWKYAVGKRQTFQMGLPGVSVLKFVSIIKSDSFNIKLHELNDVFLNNTYSNQFVWQDWKLTFEYRNIHKSLKKTLSTFYFTSSLDVAGNLLSAFNKYQIADTSGTFKDQYRVFGLVYSQFARLDNEVIYSHPIGRVKSINLRGLFGAGMPYGNSKTSMPYDYSFYAGGSNDVRGWKARALGPGSYKYYIDTNRTAIQVGDIRIVGSAEYRFLFSKFLKGAFFIDGGNIWTVRNDENRPGSKISKNWYKEIAVASGIGFRMDFDFIIVRFDFGFPMNNPALEIGERWIFQKQTNYYKDLEVFKTNNPKMDTRKIDETPFFPHVSFGIGYPF